MSVVRWGQMAGQLAASVLAILLMAAPGLAGDSSDEAWAALAKGGHVALIRHGNAPPGYGGDPPGFRFDDCQTQRNLDDAGREQARVLGEAFRKHGVRVDRIVSSPMCLVPVQALSPAILKLNGGSSPRISAICKCARSRSSVPL